MTKRDETVVGGDVASGQARRAARATGRDVHPRPGTSGEPAGLGGAGGLLSARLRLADRRNLVIGGLIILGIAAVMATVNALTALADIPRLRPWEPWVWEFTSLLMVVVLVWVPWLATAVAPPVEDGAAGWRGWARLTAVHIVALLVFSALHVAGFVALRHLAYEAMAAEYRFDALGPAPMRFLYELRKDLLNYGLFTAVFTGLAWIRQRATVAVRPVCFDIREGSQIIRAALPDIVAVSSAANYVEFWLADGRRPLMRTTLAAIEAELGAFGFVRTHRFWLVNAARVAGLRHEGSGDWTVELGRIKAPLSRRYPQALEQLKR